MSRTSLVVLGTLLLAATGARAQFPAPPPPYSAPPRGHADLSTPGVAITNLEFDVATPRDNMPGDPTLPGTVHTGRVAYGAWHDSDGTSNCLMFARSTDAGLTWLSTTSLYTYLPNEQVDGTSFQVLASGHAVYVIEARGIVDQTAIPPTAHDLWIIGSLDQGQTWSSWQLVNTGIGAATNPLWDVDQANAQIAGGVVHLVWENDYQAAPFGPEDLFYSALLLDAVAGWVIVSPETRVTQNLYSPTTIDVNSPRIAAEGNTVLIGWADNRTGNHFIYSKLSLALGLDFATLPDTSHFGTATSTARIRPPQVAVDGGNAYVMWEDTSRGGSGDELYLDVSNNSGQTWSGKTLLTATSFRDVDNPKIAAANGRVAIAFMADYRQVPGLPANYGNDIFVTVDNSAGAALLGGSVPWTVVNTLDPPGVSGTGSHDFDATLWEMEMLGDTIALCIERDWFNSSATGRNGEDAGLILSVDGGVTWDDRFASNIGSAFVVPPSPGAVLPIHWDVDDPRMAVNATGTVILGYAQDATLATAGANTFTVTGYRTPEIVDRTLTTGGIELRLANLAQRGDILAIPLSVSGTTPAFPLDPLNGIYLDMSFDLLSSVTLRIPFVFAGLIGPQGTVTLPIPNPRRFAPGVTFWAAPMGIDPTGRWSIGGEAIVIR